MRLLSTVSLCVLAKMATADNCYAPWNWCGWDLIKHGDYTEYIREHLEAAGQPINDNTINNSLWRCDSSTTGDASFLQLCPGACSYGGSGQSSDYC
ncbi:hypothetical protein F5B20DRAFT_575184 [Whalleya microplaca]|nr:hypothetical protein F5B20DRAFT_575184 [Whalleya microplaca]